MPKVPTYDGFQAIPQTAPDVRLAAPEFVNYAAEQEAQSGKAMSSAGQAIARIAADMQNDQNNIRVDAALNTARQKVLGLTYDPQQGFLALKGEAALKPDQDGLSMVDSYNQKFKTAIDEISTGLGNDAQRRLFLMRANDLGTNFDAKLQGHLLDQANEFTRSTNEGTIKLAADSAALNWNNPEEVDKNIQVAQRAVYMQGKHDGIAGNMLESNVHNVTSAIHGKVILSALDNNNPTFATQYFNKYKKDMTADDILKIQGTMNHQMDGYVANQAVGNVTSKYSANFQPTDLDRLHNLVSGDTGANGAPSAAAVSPVQGAAPISRGIQPGHKGIDYAVPVGTPAQATIGGTIRYNTADKNGWGNAIEIVGDDGKVLARYAHLSSFDLPNGSKVQAGQVIGKTGGEVGAEGAGNSRGAHLHYEQFFTSNNSKDTLQGLVKDYGDVGKALAAFKTSKADVDAAVQSASEKGGNYLNYLPKDVQSYVSTNLTNFMSGGGAPKVPSKLEFVNDAIAQLGPNPRPEQLNMTREAAERQYTLIQTSRKEQADQYFSRAQQSLIANGGNFNALDPEIKKGLATYDPGKYDDAMKFAKSIANDDHATNMDAFNMAITYPEELAKMTDSQFLQFQKTNFSLKDQERVAKIRSDFINGKEDDSSGAVNTKAFNQFLGQNLSNMGINPSPKKDDLKANNRIGAIKKYLFEDIVEMQRQAGRKFSPAEIETELNRQFTRNIEFKRTLFGVGAGSTSQQMLNMKIGDLPDGAAEGIKRALKAEGNLNPTDQDVMVRYWKVHNVAKQ